MIAVQEAGSEEGGSDEQEGIVFAAVESNQRHGPDNDRQESCKRLGQTVKFSAADPGGTAKHQVSQGRCGCKCRIGPGSDSCLMVCRCRFLTH